MDVRLGLWWRLSAEEFLEKTLESPLVCKEISPGISMEGMMLKTEAPVLWPPHAKSWLIRKDSDAGSDWGQEEKGMTEDEISGWHHWLDGREFEWTPGVGDGQGGLACCDSWGRKESDTAEWLNWTELSLSELSGTLASFSSTSHLIFRNHHIRPSDMWTWCKW